ncbi:IreB family regulatory phosphoprotein [Helcococcus kunzii]|uniref:UPF0297 protein HMPREF9709_00909 n=1 Tax=Helcococcus kunzii ATCC 51366 TaxID=883114 RepID=H3NNJ8_9FIRM|nr:IreB family regulatory phosphoprotein [Helcococcus kunzii]EHR33973.1 hypothetical protein HMPREF9709_00909 [Helcococcus kunzii ATCC 51366]MCT1795581.1 IreB family regulatory phosphoprotein [Helcococcus kunzii]MCT1989311.1 IreB family regulatory phosphoprotein [Helcococcus kunzii]QUY64824.1 IreB family regulatory phosphoprotein [Helcococcus kunzii]QZO77265.1 IreB family regulatory phosphoprotein [Helcococcus kunzii]
MSNFDKTMHFKLNRTEEDTLVETLKKVYEALEEKGYDPSNQIIGYILSGDPTYITSFKDARKMIKQIDRNELLESILNFYFEKNGIRK